MTPSRKLQVFLVLVVSSALVAGAVFFRKKEKPGAEAAQEIDVTVTNGTLRVTVKSTANVEPQNRLEVKSPTAGRIDSLLVKEGDIVKSGQVVGWISSTERAALLDAAMAHGTQELAYWKDVYKPAALTAPIDGEVIVRDFEPGQSISVTSPVIVLSDRLIVKAQVDETDIGRVKVGQEAWITLDAYPDVKSSGRIDHISYESKLVNSVTIYQVDVVPDKVPDVFRSGMSASVTVLCETRRDVPVVPGDAVSKGRNGAFVMVRPAPGEKPERRSVITGISDENGDEIREGVQVGDVVVITRKPYQLPSKDRSASPFTPFAGKQKERK